MPLNLALCVRTVRWRSAADHDPAFGYRFIVDELPDLGITASENRSTMTSWTVSSPHTPRTSCG